MSETIKDASDADKSPVLRALSLLSHVATSAEPVALADLARALRLPKPTSYRLATALEATGYLAKDPLTKRYVVGARFEDIALSAIRNGTGHEPRRIMLDALAERIGARINVAIVKSGRLLLVEWVESSSPLRVNLKPETHIPVHCSASGKLLVAYGAERLQSEFIKAAPYDALTKRTIVSARAMMRELAEIRRRGFAEDNEEFLPGVNCLAVPIRNGSGEVVAGLAAMAPVMSLPLAKLRRHVPDLQDCAKRITEELIATPRRSGKPKTSASTNEAKSPQGRKSLKEHAS
jgi:DNA-binding IclR family transcriptional regulator